MNAKFTTPEIEEFKKRIRVMCRQIDLVESIPATRSPWTLFITEYEVGLGDRIMEVTTEEMNEIFRFIIKERYL